VVVVFAPLIDQYLGLEWYGEDLSVEQFVSKFPVEAFDIVILSRAPWFDKQGRPHSDARKTMFDVSAASSPETFGV